MAQAAGQTVKLVGRTTDFKGKTLWEIVGNLKNFGKGRIIIRNMFQRYPEPSYMKILDVEALPNEDVRKVHVTVEKVFRGVKTMRPVQIYSASYKADYRLIPKELEKSFEAKTDRDIQRNKKIFPQTIDFPPLLAEFIKRETGNSNPKLPLILGKGRESLYRVALDGETPTESVPPALGLGTPASPNLYRNIPLDDAK